MARGKAVAVPLAMALALFGPACASSARSTNRPSGASGATPSFGPVPSQAPTRPPLSQPTLEPGVLASIPLEGGPLTIATGLGSVWVASHRGFDVYRIDPTTNKIVVTIDTGQESCGTPGIGFGEMWVAGCGPGDIAVIDAATNQITGRLHEGGLEEGFGAGSVWCSSLTSGVDRIDPTTLRVQATIHVDGNVVFGGGAAWVASSDGTVSRIDPGTDRVVATVPAGMAGGDGSLLWFADGKVWAYPASGSGDSASVIDPRTNAVTKVTLHPVSVSNSTFTAGMGSLWVRGLADQVGRYDEATGRRTSTLPTDTSTSGFIALGFDSLWETNLDTNTLWRVRL
jgi:streptogramin lyase